VEREGKTVKERDEKGKEEKKEEREEKTLT
jgi:hypothetical protein